VYREDLLIEHARVERAISDITRGEQRTILSCCANKVATATKQPVVVETVVGGRRIAEGVARV